MKLSGQINNDNEWNKMLIGNNGVPAKKPCFKKRHVTLIQLRKENIPYNAKSIVWFQNSIGL